ncbi:hypothetical protein GCM10010207_48190 [Streptomyces atratus]|nr:hypothetical protein GCM10010207_48190 [Streptomyces atratus]
MFFVDTMETAGLGNRSCPAGGQQAAVVVDPPRDIDRVITAAARRGVRIPLAAKTHLHNDHVTGGLEPSRVTGARLAAVPGAWDGQRLAARVSTAALQRVFGAALLAVAVFMLVDAAM